MGVGKTTLASLLSSRLSLEQISFGTAVKDDVISFNLTPDGQINKRRDRRILQDYAQFRRGQLSSVSCERFHLIAPLNPTAVFTGTNVMVMFGGGPNHHNYWVDRLAPSLDKLQSNDSCNGIIIDDIRFLNEAAYLVNNDFKLIRITMPEELRRQNLMSRDNGFDEFAFDDISEIQLNEIECHQTIENLDIEKTYLQFGKII